VRSADYVDTVQSLSALLDALPLGSSVKSIVIPNIPREDSFAKISNFIMEPISLEHIEIEGALTRILTNSFEILKKTHY
jgi:hypothetical protein